MGYLGYIQMAGFIFFCFMLFLTFKIRSCRDQLSIQTEFFLNSAVFAMSLSAYLIVNVIFPDTTSNVRVIATNLSSACLCYGFSTVSTHWILKTYYHRIRKKEENDQTNTKTEHLSLGQI